uniref:Uncharacterized protein n=1 Tax=Glossina palpalis gambiensis TaxID=67801 RepID=A0A1B0B5D8_9MUSC
MAEKTLGIKTSLPAIEHRKVKHKTFQQFYVCGTMMFEIANDAPLVTFRQIFHMKNFLFKSMLRNETDNNNDDYGIIYRDRVMLFIAAFMAVTSYDIVIKKLQMSSGTRMDDVLGRTDSWNAIVALSYLNVTDVQYCYDSDMLAVVSRFRLQECTHTPTPARLHLHNLRHVISSVISKGNKPNDCSNVKQCMHYFDDDFHVCIKSFFYISNVMQ